MRPTDDVIVKFEDESVNRVLQFILKHGLSESDLLSKRSYRSSGAAHLWKRKGAFAQMEKIKGKWVPVYPGASPDDPPVESESSALVDVDDLPAAELL